MPRVLAVLGTVAIGITVAAAVTSFQAGLAVNVVLLGCLKGVMSGCSEACGAQGMMVTDRLVFYRGVSALESNRPQLASKRLSIYVGKQPDDPVGGLFLGMAQEKCGESSKAYRTWRNADAAGFFWKRGVARSDPTDIERALAVGPVDVGMLYALGSAYAARGQAHEALGAYQAYTRSVPERSTSYWMATAYISAARGSYAEALSEYRRASRSEPRALLPRYRAAEMARKVGQLRIAAEEYESILELAPHELYATVGIAEMQWAMGDMAGAELRLRRAVANFPASALPPLVLASLCFEHNRMDEASAFAEEALRRDPSSLAAGRLRRAAESRRAHVGREE